MNHMPEAAWVGYAWDRQGFYIKVCPRCPEVAAAKRECHPLRAVEELCANHYQQQLAKRMGERL